jgi:cytochrome P450
MPAANQSGPVYEPSLFAPEALKDPFGHYRSIRELGPSVWLPDAEVHALGRFADVRAALLASERLISGQGVGFNELFNAPQENPPIIRRDGDDHRKMRQNMARPLTPAALKEHREFLANLISTRVEELVGGREFDAVTALAQYLPVNAISHLVGLPEADRLKMVQWATASFNSIGPLDPDDENYAELVKEARQGLEVREYLLAINPRDLRKGSWAASLFEAAESGSIPISEARGALAGFVLPSLDTTINAKGNLLFNLASHPGEWRKLRNDRSLIPSAVLESMRFTPVVRWFSRVAAADYDQGEVSIPRGRRVMLLYGSANRDERHFERADSFEVGRNPRDQLAWGYGAHTCVGMSLAKMEMELMLEALLGHAKDIELGDATFGANRGLYGPKHLSLTLR